METSKLKTTDEIVSYVVDANTGEITDTFMYGDSYKKSTKENREKAREFLAQKDNYVNFNTGVSFVKLYDNVLEELSEHLTNAEFNFTIRLTKHVSFKDCVLRSNGNPNGKVLDAKDLAVLMNMDPSTVRRLISSLIKKGVLGRHITGCKDDPTQNFKAITCNPYIFTRGNKVNKTALSLFADSRWGFPKEE